MAKVVIIGGGITGLSAAWELQQQGIDYVLLEASSRLGGKIITERVNGFIIEGAADSFLTQKPAAWQLCHEVGLRDRLIGTNDTARNVYVYRNGRLHLFPRGMRLIVPVEPDGLLASDLLSDVGKRRMLAEVDVPPRKPNGDESLASFVERRFGWEALEVFGESILAGIHVADPAKLSIAAAFPNYVHLEQSHGSLIRGMRESMPSSPIADAPQTAFVSLRSGMTELIEGLQAKLTGDIRLSQPVGHISDHAVYTADGEKITADAVIVTTPAHAAGELIAPALSQASELLGQFSVASSGTVSLGFRREDVDHPLDGSGFVIPHSEPTRILASTWSSSKLDYRAPEGYVLVRVFVGGYGRESDVALPDEELIALARHDLRQIMGIHAEPVISRVFRWRDANPQYQVGHLERLAAVNALCPDWIVLTGCAYGGIGIPDCVCQGREAARRIVSKL
jgi:protoporphyrinogen/coproporphyrinogen III oxidase